MSPNLAMIRDGKKFMWDGLFYESQEQASRAAQFYGDEDFQVQFVEEAGKVLVYTRRTSKQVAVTAQ
jgi:hypothetical protein